MFLSDKEFNHFYPYKKSKKEIENDLSGNCSFLYSTGEWGFVIERNSDKAVIGLVILNNSYNLSHKVLKLGYYVGEEYRLHGYAQKAFNLIIDNGFKGKLYQLDDSCFKNRKYVFQAFKASADLDNDVSDYILRKLGFVCSGIEFCVDSIDKSLARDQRHYYLENPKHPPKRVFKTNETYENRIFGPFTNKPLTSENFNALMNMMIKFYGDVDKVKEKLNKTSLTYIPKIDKKAGLPILPDELFGGLKN